MLAYLPLVLIIMFNISFASLQCASSRCFQGSSGVIVNNSIGKNYTINDSYLCPSGYKLIGEDLGNVYTNPNTCQSDYSGTTSNIRICGLNSCNYTYKSVNNSPCSGMATITYSISGTCSTCITSEQADAILQTKTCPSGQVNTFAKKIKSDGCYEITGECVTVPCREGEDGEKQPDCTCKVPPQSLYNWTGLDMGCSQYQIDSYGDMQDGSCPPGMTLKMIAVPESMESGNYSYDFKRKKLHYCGKQWCGDLSDSYRHIFVGNVVDKCQTSPCKAPEGYKTGYYCDYPSNIQINPDGTKAETSKPDLSSPPTGLTSSDGSTHLYISSGDTIWDLSPPTSSDSDSSNFFDFEFDYRQVLADIKDGVKDMVQNQAFMDPTGYLQDKFTQLFGKLSGLFDNAPEDDTQDADANTFDDNVTGDSIPVPNSDSLLDVVKKRLSNDSLLIESDKTETEFQNRFKEKIPLIDIEEISLNCDEDINFHFTMPKWMDSMEDPGEFTVDICKYHLDEYVKPILKFLVVLICVLLWYFALKGVK